MRDDHPGRTGSAVADAAGCFWIPVYASEFDWPAAMSQIPLRVAIASTEQYLNTRVRSPHDLSLGDRWVILSKTAKDCGEHWLFQYQSLLYIETGNPSYRWMERYWDFSQRGEC
jgi:hypothetical protein